MKVKLVKVLGFCILSLMLCSNVQAKVLGNQQSVVQLQMQPTDDISDLKIVDAKTQVRIGEIGYITIQGQPGVRYTVTSSFMIGNDVRNVSQWRVTDNTGKAVFVWSVSAETVPGTYPITISGGGRTLNLSHTVIR